MLIVADSSSDEKRMINRNTIQKISDAFGVNIVHLEYNQIIGPSGEGFFWKWGDGVQHVDTDYSQICTDKEFCIPSTQCKCVEFLENNSGYDAVDGEYYYLEKIGW